MVRVIIWLITFLGGLFFLLEFLLPAAMPGWLGGFENPLTRILPDAHNFVMIISAMAFLLGPLNLVRSHGSNILKRNKGWVESIVFMVFIPMGFLVQLLFKNQLENRYYSMLIYGLMYGFGTSSMALLAFYLVSAAFRSFRLNSLEAGVMMAAAVIVLLGQVPLGTWITQKLPEAFHLRTAATWVFMVPNNAVQRAVIMGAAGGAFAASLRHWLSLGKAGE